MGDAFSMSPQLEKLYRASGQPVPHSKRALEVNADHPLITGLDAAYKRTDDKADLADTAKLIYGMAVLAEGGDLPDPAEFSRLLAESLTETVAG